MIKFVKTSACTPAAPAIIRPSDAAAQLLYILHFFRRNVKYTSKFLKPQKKKRLAFSARLSIINGNPESEVVPCPLLCVPAARSRATNSLPVGLALAFAGGFFDAYTYLTRGGVFANAQTGNIVLMSLAAARGDAKAAAYYLLPICAFFWEF